MKERVTEAVFGCCTTGCRRHRDSHDLGGNLAEWGLASSFEWLAARGPQPQTDYVSLCAGTNPGVITLLLSSVT